MAGPISIHFSRVVFLESKEAADHHNGEELQRRFSQRAPNAGLSCSYRKVSNVAELISAIAEEARQASPLSTPLLHIEAHGDRQGIESEDGGVALWEDLRPPLQELNRKAQGHLVVTVGACHGIWLAESLLGDGFTPFAAFIGLDERVRSRSLLEGWEAFYQRLVDTRSFDEAIRAANVCLRKNREPELHALTAFGLVRGAARGVEEQMYHRAAIRLHARSVYRRIHRSLDSRHKIFDKPFHSVMDCYRTNIAKTFTNGLREKLGLNEFPNSPLRTATEEYLLHLGPPRRRKKGKSFRRTYLRKLRQGKWSVLSRSKQDFLQAVSELEAEFQIASLTAEL